MGSPWNHPSNLLGNLVKPFKQAAFLQPAHGSIAPHHRRFRGTGGTRMVHRQQLFSKLLMLDAEENGNTGDGIKIGNGSVFFFFKEHWETSVFFSGLFGWKKWNESNDINLYYGVLGELSWNCLNLECM